MPRGALLQGVGLVDWYTSRVPGKVGRLLRLALAAVVALQLAGWIKRPTA